jgi:hypothetical protein
MQPVCSPFHNGDMARYRWYQVLLIPKWNRYFASLKSQIASRGLVPPEMWGSHEQHEVARRIEEVLCRVCWGEHFTFHPLDPLLVVGEWEVGDLSEVQALMEIEREFAITISREELDELLANGTFGDLVNLVSSKANRLTSRST